MTLAYSLEECCDASMNEFAILSTTAVMATLVVKAREFEFFLSVWVDEPHDVGNHPTHQPHQTGVPPARCVAQSFGCVQVQARKQPDQTRFHPSLIDCAHLLLTTITVTHTLNYQQTRLHRQTPPGFNVLIGASHCLAVVAC